MTIAVSKFVSAAAATASASVAPAPGDAGVGALQASDFASLLFGQLRAELAPLTAPGQDTGRTVADEPLSVDTGAATDTGSLFAALGLPLPPADTAARTMADAENRPLPPAAGNYPIGVETGHSLPPGSERSDGTANRSTAGMDALDAARQFPPRAVGANVADSGDSGNSVTVLPPSTGAVPATAGDGAAPATPTSVADAFSPAIIAGMGKTSADAQAVTTPIAPPVATAAPPAGFAPPVQQAPAPHTEMARIDTPVRAAEWPGELSQKVVWMTRQDIQSAQITLNPPQMGPIEITLDVRNDQATATFVSANAEVRETIESSLPKLREMLAGVGVELGQANVRQESSRQANADGNDARRTMTGGSGNGEGATATAAPLASGRGAERLGRGLVDTFA